MTLCLPFSICTSHAPGIFSKSNGEFADGEVMSSVPVIISVGYDMLDFITCTTQVTNCCIVMLKTSLIISPYPKEDSFEQIH